jgi:hypothetical protein
MLNDTTSQRTRRRFLTTTATGAVGALAGCGAAASSEDDPFDDLSVEGTNLVVTLSSSARTDELELQSPDGSPFVRQRVESDANRVTLPLIESSYTATPEHYRAGENTVVARRDGDPVGRRTVSLTPEVGITDMWLADETEFNPTVAIENTGTAPTFVTYLGFDGVPNPTPPPTETTGLPEERGVGVPLPPTIRELQSGSMPFAFRRLPSKSDTLSCPGRTSVEVTVRTVHGDTVTETFPVQFGGEIENVLWLSHRCSDVTVQPDD